jgi:diaminopimelate decarboxylase
MASARHGTEAARRASAAAPAADGKAEAIAELGGGADCASRDEAWAAMEAGIPVDRITYNSPAPDPKLAVWLLRSGASVVADSVDALEDIRAGLSGAEFDGRLFVRVSPGGLPGYRTPSDFHRYTAHGGEQSAFGIPSETLAEVLADYPLPVTGLHMHVGTQMDNLQAFVAGLEFLHSVSDYLEEHTPHRFSTLNLGGGLGIPFFDDQEIPSIDELTEALRPLRRDGLTYEVEPGNSLVGNAVALLAGVSAVKTMRGRRIAIL